MIPYGFCQENILFPKKLLHNLHVNYTISIMYDYKFIFSQYPLANAVAPNRFVAQAIECNSADEYGRPTKEIFERYKQLAHGRWGIICVEAIAISNEAKARKHGLVLSSHSVHLFKQLIQAIKAIDNQAIVIVQLTHAGRQCFDSNHRVKVYPDSSTIPLLSTEQIKKIQQQFEEAIALTAETGADGIDIKACHGYLLDEMLRPANNRDDQFGGDYKNRSYLIASLFRYARQYHPHLIVGSRISMYEGIRGGCGTNSANEIIEDLTGMLSILSIMVDAGAQYINVSAGVPTVTPALTRPIASNAFDLYHHIRYTYTTKKQLSNIATIGSAYTAAQDKSLSLADENCEKQYTDFIGFGRQSLADPLLPIKAKEVIPINWCTLCSGCSTLLKKQQPVHCIKYKQGS